MRWDYRVVDENGELGIYDVYYNESGSATSRHEAPSYVYGKSLDELREQLARMSEALEKPVLKDQRIGKQDTAEPTGERYA